MRYRRMMFGSVVAVGLTCGLLLLACSSGHTQTQQKPSAPQPTAVGEEGEPATATQGTSYVIDSKTYFAPVVVKQADMYMEGGTLSLLIADARGKELRACNDGRGCLNCKDTPMQRPIYIGGYHPIAKTAKPLPLGGADERELYRMLKTWFGEAEKQGGPKFPDDSMGLRARTATDFLHFLEQHVERHKPK
jgi:hypothetical protein